MNEQLIVGPMIAMVALTFVVWVRMFVVRVAEIKQKKLSPNDLSDSKQVALKLERVTAADNFRNLFELPVLFYTLCVNLLLTNQVDTLMLVGAWAFVLLRVAHSAIHLTYNDVMHRFQAYVVGGVCLYSMWLLLGIRWLISLQLPA